MATFDPRTARLVAEMNRCARCILPASYPGIDFDEDGICSFCRSHGPRGYSGLERLRQRILTAGEPGERPAGGHDCLMAFSGGRDSTYMLHLLVNELHLRPLAYFLDNGLVPAVTHENLRRTVERLEVDLVVEAHDRLTTCLRTHVETFLHRPSPATVGLLCAGCRLALSQRIAAFAVSRGLPVVVFGSNPIDALGGFKLDLLRWQSDRPGLAGLVAGYLREMAKNPRWLLSPRCLSIQAREFRQCFSRPTRSRESRLLMLAPFDDAIRWVEKDVVETIRQHFDWQKSPGVESSWRGDCRLAPLKSYISRGLLGFNDVDVLLSYLIRDGQIDREEALERLRREGMPPDEVIDETLAEIGFSGDDLRRALAAG